jgi:fatty acid desaturase
MSNHITVKWADLLRLSKFDVCKELTLSLPWLIASWFFAFRGQYWPALACSFMFFLTGLRQTHNAYHYTLGLSRRSTHWVMFGLSILMLGSMHSVQINHLRHHRYCMDDEDIEAMSARLTWWKSILVGPLFPIRLHRKAIEVGTPGQRNWIFAELGANTLWIAVVFGVLQISWLKYHICVMAIGQCLTAFFAVWTVHHGCDTSETLARTIRGRIKALITYNMFFHAEHHMFPTVPTCKLFVLAQRLDAAAPKRTTKRVF